MDTGLDGDGLFSDCVFAESSLKTAKIDLRAHPHWIPAKTPLLPLRNVLFSKIGFDPAVK